VVYFGNFEEEPDELLFWLYTTLIEDILPIGFYNQMIEPQVLKSLLNEIFMQIDPHSAAIFGEIPSMYFMPHFFSLFTELQNQVVSNCSIVSFRFQAQF
jgi:hypothetical protein